MPDIDDPPKTQVTIVGSYTAPPLLVFDTVTSISWASSVRLAALSIRPSTLRHHRVACI